MEIHMSTVHTADHPDGMIRGQCLVISPDFLLRIKFAVVYDIPPITKPIITGRQHPSSIEMLLPRVKKRVFVN